MKKTKGKIKFFENHVFPLLVPFWHPIWPPWSHLGGMLGPYEAILEALGAILGSPGPSWALFGPSWSLPGASLDHLGASLWPLGASLWPPWVFLEPFSGFWGPSGGQGGWICVPFGSFWIHFGSLVIPCGASSMYSRPDSGHHFGSIRCCFFRGSDTCVLMSSTNRSNR